MGNKVFKYLRKGSIAIMILLCMNVFAQEKEKKITKKAPFKDRISVGGVLGFSFSSNTTLVDISPILAYRVTNEFYTGLGLTYKFYKYSDYYLNLDNGALEDYKTHMYGGSVFARYYLSKLEIPVIRNLFLHAEVEPIFFTNEYKMSPDSSYIDGWGNLYVKDSYQTNFTSVFLGGGISQPVGNNSYVFLEVLWNFNEDFYTPYNNPRIRIGFWGGF